jgi:hypothetical protein
MHVRTLCPSPCSEEEQQKTTLSMACVNLLRGVSEYTELRRLLRQKQLAMSMKMVLKAEEDLHSPENPVGW